MFVAALLVLHSVLTTIIGLSSMNLTFGKNSKTGSINVGTGTIPGVLFVVTRLWSLAVFFLPFLQLSVLIV
jgi:hypothetical protein